jgi:hypothetical protein
MRGKDYLSDPLIAQLKPYDEGILHRAWYLLSSHTDEPGRFILRGVACDLPTVSRHLTNTYPPSTTRVDAIQRSLNRIIAAGLLTVKDGVLTSPAIVKAYEKYKLASYHGKKGVAKKLKGTPKGSANGTLKGYINQNQNKNKKYSSSSESSGSSEVSGSTETPTTTRAKKSFSHTPVFLWNHPLMARYFDPQHFDPHDDQIENRRLFEIILSTPKGKPRSTTIQESILADLDKFDPWQVGMAIKPFFERLDAMDNRPDKAHRYFYAMVKNDAGKYQRTMEQKEISDEQTAQRQRQEAQTRAAADPSHNPGPNQIGDVLRNVLPLRRPPDSET